MKNIFCFLMLLFTTISFAQGFDESKFLGTWTLETMNGKALDKGIAMKLVVEEGNLAMMSPNQTVDCEWSFSPDKTHIYSSNERSDEEWKIIELTENKLVFSDRGQKMQFKKVASYQKPKTEEELDPNILTGVAIESEKQLLGDWHIVKADGKDIAKENLGFSFRPKGGMLYRFLAMDTPASWELSEDKKIILITAFNGLTEKWVIRKYADKELVIYVSGKLFSCKRK